MKRIVGISGGIDSQACALWVRQRFPAEEVILCNSDAGGNEHPITTQFLRDYSERVHPVVFLSATVADMRGRAKGKIAAKGLSHSDLLTFDLMADLKSAFPSRLKQFCTHHLKLYPQLRWIKENSDGLLADGYERYIGVRADESQDRANLPEQEWDAVFDCELFRPVLRWTKEECFDFVRNAGEEVNPLYMMGFNRVGCAPCVNSNKQDIRNWAARAPEMIDKVREWEARVGKTFFMPLTPSGEINWVDEVVAWSRTVRGGRQIALPFVEADAANGQCVSKYGLCE